MKQTLGVVLFALGLLAGIAFAAVTVWGDLEAALFDPSGSGEERLSSLACPVLITREETGIIAATFENTGTLPVNRAVRFHVSMGRATLMREESTHVPLAPGESKRLHWPVDAADAAYGGLFILPRVSGSVVVGAWLALSLAGMLGGGWLWLAVNPRRTWRGRSTPYIMLALGSAVTVAIALGLLGLWFAGVLALALILLLLIAVFAQVMLAG